VRVAVVGDLGSAKYHVGDEAMSLYAVDALRTRGIHDIVVVGDDARLARERFGTDAVERPRFVADGGPENPRRLERMSAGLSGRGWLPAAMKEVAGCDALLIAGGGNVSTQHPHHLYERLALSRAARSAGRPVLVTSQTFGPLVLPGDQPAFEELLTTATAIGVRERDSFALARRTGVADDRLTLIPDDAAWLEPTDEDRRWVDEQGLGPRIVTMSLTYHRGSTGYPYRSYIERAAATADALAERLDAEIVLVAHLGVIGGDADPIRDVLHNTKVRDASSSGRVRLLPMTDARRVIEVARRSLVCVTTRYHPTVFGPFSGVPAIGIATGYYSSLRMRGALGHLGLQDFVLPAEIWDAGLVLAAVDELVERHDEVQQHIAAAVPAAREHADIWWDSLVASIRDGGPWSSVPSVPAAPKLPTPTDGPRWRSRAAEVLGVSDRLTRRATTRLWQEKAARLAAEDALDVAKHGTGVRRTVARARRRLSR